MSATGFQEKLLQLRQEYADLLPQKLADIEAVWTSLRQQPQQPDALRQFRAFVHTLAGSGATFGFPELSAQASELESLVDQLLKDVGALARIGPAITSGIQLLKRAASVRETHVDQVREDIPVLRTALYLGKHLYWLGSDPLKGQTLASQLERFTYKVSLFSAVEDLTVAIELEKPSVVVIDLGEDERQIYPDALSVIERLAPCGPPIVVLCPESYDLAMWPQAIRAGAVICINRPLVLYEVLEKLDQLTFHWEEPPYRLLLIDDDAALAKNMALILTKAGMQVVVETNALKVPQTLEKFQPDLILVDLYMPDCSGLELARLIRQERRYLAVPIVYLSAETEVHKRLDALEAGADDFILKPVKLNFLYHALSSRIKRARQIRSFHERDMLTGLFCHTLFQEKLHESLRSASREGKSLVVVLVDIDRFKAINEHHGHAMGDKVLQVLAIKLKRRFAQSAMLARYDGATLALAFPGVALESVRLAMEGARDDFKRVDHDANGIVFEASFSAGVAAYPAFTTVVDLLDACQKALLRAKSSGRNKVVLLDDSSPSSVDDNANPFVFLSDSFDQAPAFLDEDDAPEDSLFLMEDGETDLAPLSQDNMERAIQKSDAFASLNSDDFVTTDDVADAQVEPTEPRQKIVVVDDDKQLMQVLVSFLTGNGFEAFGAGTGEEGYALVLQHQPELVLIDLLLFPGIHGFELCKKIKTNVNLRGTGIILMTAVYKDYRYQMEGKEAGGDAFLIKPINFEELLVRIKEVQAKMGKA